jgi:hypothetical protein
VRDTSRAAYQDGRERFTGRQADVLRWLGHYLNHHVHRPTSGELARFVEGRHVQEVDGWEWAALILHVRRGISDLQTSGVVEATDKRRCQETGRTCHTWRVVTR